MSKASVYFTDQRDTVIEQHASLVKRIAHHLIGRLPASVQIDDLIQAGMIGLLEASKNYDGSKGASFETYAGIRIRGAMLDEIRRGDWAPRSVHRNSRRIADAVQIIEQQSGRDATDIEIAQKLDISLDEYHHILRDVSVGKIIGFEDLGGSVENAAHGHADHDDGQLYNKLQHEHFQTSLANAIRTLPEREALVLSLYYDEDLNLKEIGEVLSVSESRVSQIHSQAMHRLKARMRDWQS